MVNCQKEKLYHVKPVVEGGKTTPKNTRVVTEAKNQQIHKNRAKKERYNRFDSCMT